MILSRVSRELDEWSQRFFAAIPGVIGVVLRRVVLTPQFKSCGKKLSVGCSVRWHGLGRTLIGDFATIGEDSFLSASGGELSIGDRLSCNLRVIIVADHGKITIGKNVLIGMSTVIRSSNHRVDRLPEIPIIDQGHESGVVEIGDGVWIGANCVILPGAKIGKNSVIAAGSVVKDTIPEGCMAAGAPAIEKKKLFSKTTSE